MEYYLNKMIKCGFSLSRAFSVYVDFRNNNDLDGLKAYINAIESDFRSKTNDIS